MIKMQQYLWTILYLETLIKTFKYISAILNPMVHQKTNYEFNLHQILRLSYTRHNLA